MATKSKSRKSSSYSRANLVKCNFFIADDIRIEQGGKPSLLGFYADNIILVRMPKKSKDPTKDRPIGIGSFAILANFVGVKGTHDVEMELFGPGGPSLLKTGKGKLSSVTENLNFISQFRPLPVVGFGQYKVVIMLDQESFAFTFDIRRGEPPLSAQDQVVFQLATGEKVKARKKD
jgi:hypothetical protein